MVSRLTLALLLMTVCGSGVLVADDECRSCDVDGGDLLASWRPRFRWCDGESRPLSDWPLMHWTDLSWRHPGDHPDPDDPERHIGRGEPLVGTSWLNRPLYAGWILGGLFGGELIRGRVDQGSGAYGGYHVGSDFDHYWGLEGRFGFSNVDLSLDGVGADRTSRDWFVDANLLYYPWGDAYWRPYLSLGLGLADFTFFDDQGQRVGETLVQIPLGLGVKCNFQRWLALRAGLTDNLAFGGGTVSAVQNVSLTFGVEVRFGGGKISYYPW